MGPESSERKFSLYMMADGQPVEIEPEFVEITLAGDQQKDDAPMLNNCEFSIELGQIDSEEMAHMMACVEARTEEEAQKVVKVAHVFAERSGVSLVEAVATVLNALQIMRDELRAQMENFTRLFEEIIRPNEEHGEPLNLPTVWDRKEAREKRRAVERATASRFRQYKAKESAWAAQKRTGQRRREWRGPWKEN